jgi:hypothetical protein
MTSSRTSRLYSTALYINLLKYFQCIRLFINTVLSLSLVGTYSFRIIALKKKKKKNQMLMLNS